MADDQGHIIAFDSRDFCFDIFDEQGRFIRKFGRKGQGPDEIGAPMGVMLTKTGQVAVMDHGNNRLAIYSIDGTGIARVPLKTVRPFSPVMDGRGSVYGSVLSFSPKPRLDLIKFDSELEPTKTLASLVLPKDNEIPPAELMHRFIYQGYMDDSVVWADNFRYQLNIVNARGDLTLQINRAAKARKLEKTVLVREMRRRYPADRVPDMATIPRHFPDSFPFFESIVCDDEGRIYVRTFEAVGSGRARYDVFDASGIYVARFDVPEDEDITAVKHGRAYALIKENAAGNPMIKRFKLDWK